MDIDALSFEATLQGLPYIALFGFQLAGTVPIVRNLVKKGPRLFLAGQPYALWLEFCDAPTHEQTRMILVDRLTNRGNSAFTFNLHKDPELLASCPYPVPAVDFMEILANVLSTILPAQRPKIFVLQYATKVCAADMMEMHLFISGKFQGGSGEDPLPRKNGQHRAFVEDHHRRRPCVFQHRRRLQR